MIKSNVFSKVRATRVNINKNQSSQDKRSWGSWTSSFHVLKGRRANWYFIIIFSNLMWLKHERRLQHAARPKLLKWTKYNSNRGHTAHVRTVLLVFAWLVSAPLGIKKDAPPNWLLPATPKHIIMHLRRISMIRKAILIIAHLTKARIFENVFKLLK